MCVGSNTLLIWLAGKAGAVATSCIYTFIPILSIVVEYFHKTETSSTKEVDDRYLSVPYHILLGFLLLISAAVLSVARKLTVPEEITRREKLYNTANTLISSDMEYPVSHFDSTESDSLRF